MLTLEPERPKNRPAAAGNESRDRGDPDQTLKLLAASEVQRRNALLSSKPLE
jgi:hypothetical protein